jgi:hypothetical protein
MLSGDKEHSLIRETKVLKQSRQPRLLTTRVRTAVAFVLTAFMFVLAVRGPSSGHTENWMVVPAECCAPRLAANSCERFPLRLHVLGGILAHS